MSSQSSITSILSGLSADDLKIIDQLLNARQQQSYLLGSSSDSDSDTTNSLVDDYSSDDEETEPVLKKSPKGKKRGRPKKIRTEEEIATMKANIEAKEQRRLEREIKDEMKSDEVVAKQHRSKMRNEAVLWFQERAEKLQKAI